MGPLDGRRVLEHSHGPAVGFAGLLLRMLGAAVELLELEGASPLRGWPPRHDGASTLYGYVAAGKRRRSIADLRRDQAAGFNVIIHDADLPADLAALLEASAMPAEGRVVVRCTPYGAVGPKSGWQATELSLFQAGGEGYLMPHGLPYEEHPERPPIGVGRYSAHYQGGIAAALAAVAGLQQSRMTGKTEHVDVSIQDAELSLNYFTVSRYVEGVRESRSTRAFRYAGILRCADGYAELVPLENHHWAGVLELLGHPAELTTGAFDDLISRASQGGRINDHLRRWAIALPTAEVVRRAREAGVPCGPYVSPADLPDDAQIAHRGYFVSERADPDRQDLFPGPAWVFNRWEKPRLGRADANHGAADAST